MVVLVVGGLVVVLVVGGLVVVVVVGGLVVAVVVVERALIMSDFLRVRR